MIHSVAAFGRQFFSGKEVDFPAASRYDERDRKGVPLWPPGMSHVPMEKKTRKLMRAAGVTAAAAATAAITSYTTMNFMLRVATDRKAPGILDKTHHLISGSKKPSEITDEKRILADRLAVRENEAVQILSRDGVSLTGHWVPQKDAKRVIVAMHGWRSSWYWDFGMFSDFWEQNGCSVLYAEQRAQGNSGGESICFGVEESLDCLEWVQWVIRNCGPEIPVYLAGVSMGATTVLMAAGLEMPASVHGIMADCGFTSPRAIWRYVATENLHMGLSVRGPIAEALLRKRIPLHQSLESTVDALKKCTVPVLFVHGTADHFVPVEMTYENYMACASPKRLLIVPGAGHGRSFLTDRDGYEAAVRAFWNDFDAS